MANHASALKAHRQSLNRRARNRSNVSQLRNALKKITQQIASGQVEEARASLPALYALIDRSVRKKAISRNAADRRKSRLTIKLNKVAKGS